MHITIEHREAIAGIGGQQREYYVDTTVRFSEEERSIIELRKLYSHKIAVGYPNKPYEPNPFVEILERLAPAVGLLAFGLLITSPFTGLGTLAFLLILASMAMWGYPIWVMYQK